MEFRQKTTERGKGPSFEVSSVRRPGRRGRPEKELGKRDSVTRKTKRTGYDKR